MALVKTPTWTIITSGEALHNGFPMTMGMWPKDAHVPNPVDDPDAHSVSDNRPPTQTYSVYLRHADGTIYAAALTRAAHLSYRRSQFPNREWEYELCCNYHVYRWDQQIQQWRQMITCDAGTPYAMLGRKEGRGWSDIPLNEEECRTVFTHSFKTHLSSFFRKKKKEGTISCVCQKLSTREAEGTFPTFTIPRPDGIRSPKANRYDRDETTVWVVVGVGNMKFYRPVVYHVWDQPALSDGGGISGRDLLSVWRWGPDDDDWTLVEDITRRQIGYGGGQLQKMLEDDYRKWVRDTSGY
jgi:hypothetical protein